MGIVDEIDRGADDICRDKKLCVELTREECMYVLLIEDGEIYTTDQLTDEDYEACRDGVVEILSIHSDAHVTAYNGTCWIKLKPRDSVVPKSRAMCCTLLNWTTK